MKNLLILSVSCCVMFTMQAASSSLKLMLEDSRDISPFVSELHKKFVHIEFVRARRDGPVRNWPGQGGPHRDFIERAVVQDYLCFENYGAQNINQVVDVASLADGLQNELLKKPDLLESLSSTPDKKPADWERFHKEVRSLLMHELKDEVALKETDAETMEENKRGMTSAYFLPVKPFQIPKLGAAILVMVRMLNFHFKTDPEGFIAQSYVRSILENDSRLKDLVLLDTLLALI